MAPGAQLQHASQPLRELPIPQISHLLLLLDPPETGQLFQGQKRTFVCEYGVVTEGSPELRGLISAVEELPPDCQTLQLRRDIIQEVMALLIEERACWRLGPKGRELQGLPRSLRCVRLWGQGDPYCPPTRLRPRSTLLRTNFIAGFFENSL